MYQRSATVFDVLGAEERRVTSGEPAMRQGMLGFRLEVATVQPVPNAPDWFEEVISIRLGHDQGTPRLECASDVCHGSIQIYHKVMDAEANNDHVE